MENKIKDEILHDYREDVVSRKRECDYWRDWSSWNILRKTIEYELCSSKDVESYPYIKNEVFAHYSKAAEGYETADIMNGWWYCFKSLFGIKNGRRNADTKEFEEELRKCIEEKKDDKSVITAIYNINEECLEVFLKYLKVVYTIGNITPAPINPRADDLDSWEYKLSQYIEKYPLGFKEALYFQDYYDNNGIIKGYTTKSYKENPVKYMNSRIELILKRAYRICKNGKEIGDDCLKELIKEL